MSAAKNDVESEVVQHTSIPTWLNAPPATPESDLDSIPTTLAQDLPIGSLQWEDFQRLCLRLVESKGSIRQCAQYGARGQRQQGIDLYSLDDSGEYFTYQCRQVASMAPSNIKKAVEDFLLGTWADKAKGFALCTTYDLTASSLQDAIVWANQRLGSLGHVFQPLGKQEILLWLKNNPKVVFDFFGESLAKKFCGEATIAGLKRRLSPDEIRSLRSELGALYETVFRINTRSPINQVGSLRDEFVDLDVSTRRSPPETENGSQEISLHDSIDQHFEFELDDGFLESPRLPPPPMNTGETRQLRSLTQWATEEDACLLVGGPGSGKSTALRTFALDILSEEPKFPALSTRYGSSIPLWVPFSFWVDSISNYPDFGGGLEAVLQRWLSDYGAERLWPLVERGLDDERIVLLIDGLDEFKNLASAEKALASLAVHVRFRKCAMVGSARVQAIQQLQIEPLGWPIGSISPLSREQQHELIENRLRRNETDADARSDLAKSLIDELDTRDELDDLAETPMFLANLCDLWFATRALPVTRAATHEAVIRLLTEQHDPLRTRLSGLDDPIPQVDNELRISTIASLALLIQRSTLARTKRLDAEQHVAKYLEIHGIADSNAVGRSLVELFTDRYGLLLKTSDGGVEFLHRALQEYLSARSLIEAVEQTRSSIVDEHVSDLNWHQVFRYLIGMSPSDSSALLASQILAAANAQPHLVGLEILLAESAAESARLPSEISNALIIRASDIIETQPLFPGRGSLIRSVVRALRRDETSATAYSSIARWFPYRYFWPRSGIEIVSHWSASSETADVYMRALDSEDVGTRIVAAEALRSIDDDALLTDRLLSRVRRSWDVDTRAASLLALSSNQDSRVVDAIEACWKSTPLQLRIVAGSALVERGERGEEILHLLLSAIVESAPIDDSWQSVAIASIVRGWSGDENLRDSLLQAYTSSREAFRSRTEIDRNSAVSILLRAFPHDNSVGEALSREFENQNPFLWMMKSTGQWRLIANNFRDDPALTEAIDRWLPKQNSIQVIESAFSSLVGRTEIGKQTMLSNLSNIWPHWAAGALIEGWGMEDPEISVALSSIANGASREASHIAHLIPRILEDPSAARTRLLELLDGDMAVRKDLVLDGLAELGIGRDDTLIETRVLAILDQGSDPAFRSQVINYLPWVSKVRELALSELTDPEGDWFVVARSFENDPEIRDRILKSLTPLEPIGRAILIGELEKPGTPRNYRNSLLQHYDAESDSNLATRSAISYFKSVAPGIENASLQETLIERMTKSGIQHDVRTEAAFAASLALGFPEILLNAHFAWAPDTPVTIPLARTIGKNGPLVRLILGNWDLLKERFGEEFWLRISGTKTPSPETWIGLLSAADNYPGPCAEALEYFSDTGPTAPHYHQSPEILAFLGRVDPGGTLLKRFCISTIAPGSADLGGWVGEEFAAELLASHFGGDSNVLAELLEAIHFVFPGGEYWSITDGTLCALAEGWPECHLLDAEWDTRNDVGRRTRTEGAIAQLVSVRASSAEFIDWLNRRISEARPVDPPSRRARGRAIRRRLKADSEAMDYINHTARDSNSSSSLQISMFEIIANAGAALEDDVSALAKSLLVDLMSHSNHEAVPEQSDVGFGIITGQTRALAPVIAEIFYGTVA